MLHSIKISNFRSCDDVLLQLDQSTTALVGKNGVGKTNLLHAIHLAASLCAGIGEWQTLEPQDRRAPAELSLIFMVTKRRYVYTVRHTVGEHYTTTQLEESLLDTTDSEPRTLFTRTGESAQTAFYPATQIGIAASTLSAMLQLSPSTSDAHHTLRPISDFLKSVRYYRLNDNIRDHEWIPPLVSEATYQQWAADPLRPGPNADSVALRLIHMHVAQQDRLEELKALIGESGLGLVSNIYIHRTDLRQPTNSGAADRGTYMLGFSPGPGLAGAGRFFPYSGLSAGTRRVIQLLTYLVFDESTVMLLEQPEDSIHAGLLRRVLDVLATYSHRSQLILTTHSPRVVNLLQPEQVRIVSAIDGRTSVHQLSLSEVQEASGYIQDLGTLSEYLETI